MACTHEAGFNFHNMSEMGGIVVRLEKKIGFIGAGNMGEAMIGALIQSETIASSKIYVTDIAEKRLELLKNKYGVHVGSDNSFLFNTCDIIILSVKPQIMEDVLIELTNEKEYKVNKNKLIISIAAGVPIKKLEKWFYQSIDDDSAKKLSIIRVMPNTPCLVSSGMSGFCVNSNTTKDDVESTKTILGAMGKAIAFSEKDMDAVTALSGSGPAYVFFLAEVMIAAGMELGFSKEDASTLSLETIKGALLLMESVDDAPQELRKKVTSPGGTTEAAFKVLEKGEVKKNFIEAIKAAASRSKELSD